jgi:hypothetical protein
MEKPFSRAEELDGDLDLRLLTSHQLHHQLNSSLIGAQQFINLLFHFSASRSGVSTGRKPYCLRRQSGMSNPSAAIDAPPA